jgi:alpha,alpha-trehalase
MSLQAMESHHSGVGKFTVSCCAQRRKYGRVWIGSSLLGWFMISLFVDTVSVALGQTKVSVVVPVRTVMEELLTEEDTDSDLKITANDLHVLLTPRGDKEFSFAALDHKRYEVTGAYYLSNLLQELRLLEETGRDTADLRMDRIFELPLERISRNIRELYWDGLTRRIDESGLPAILRDDKTSTIDGRRYLYVPAEDTFAFDYFDALAHRHTKLNLEVVQLPMQPTPEYARSRDGLHGILSLAYTRGVGDSVRGVPFVVPGGRFNEMYGWDSYFIVLGLLQDGRVDLARSIVDNFVYEIANYGKVLNANRTYYLTRSQPPFLTSMVLEVYKHLPKDSLGLAWLRTVIEASIKEYRGVWMNSDHLTSTGLSRYFDPGQGAPPEVEPGHFDAIFARFAEQRGMDRTNYEHRYKLGLIEEPDLDQYFVQDRAMRESGHDTSYRLYDRCADLVTVDLNSLLYKIERDIATVLNEQFGGSITLNDGTLQRSDDWSAKASTRKELMNRYLWDPTHSMFFDYDVRKGERTAYVSATTFYPLWAGLATKEQARALVEKALPLLEMPGGLASSTEASRGAITPDHPLRQWDYPYGWAPHQMLLWHGFKNYGYDFEARRLAYRWLYTITLNATSYNGTVTEKYDVVNRSHEVFAEYGNVGTKFAYITKEGFGWTNASYQVGLELLSRRLRTQLDSLIAPEIIFPQRN